MPISAGTTTQIQFLRRLSSQDTPPIYTFPVSDTSTAYRFGQPVSMDATNGKVALSTGAAGTGIVISVANSIALVGFVAGAAIEAFTAPTAGGAHAGGIAFTSAASLTANDPIPTSEQVQVILSLGDCIFRGHMANGATDITAPTRAFVAATGGLVKRMGISVLTPTGETARGILDTTAVTTNTIAIPWNWAYPQPIPQARSKTAGADAFRVITGASGTSNPAVEFSCVGTAWNPTA